MTDAAQRLQGARAALQKVENLTGVRAYGNKHLADVRPFPGGVGIQAPGRRPGKEAAAEAALDLATDLSPGVYQVPSTVPALAYALQQSLAAGGWGAVSGVTNMGWEALAKLGIDLAQLVILQCPPQQVAAILGIALEGFDVVVTGDGGISYAQQRALAARARGLGRVIVTTQVWPASASLEVGGKATSVGTAVRLWAV